jgi:hypothetical protein
MSAVSIKPYAIELMESVLMPGGGSPHLPNNDAIVQILLPYQLKELDSGLLLPVNRFYKPLGVSNKGSFTGYEDNKYASLRLYKDDIDRTHLKLGSYFYEAAPVDHPLYLVKLYLTFRKLGFAKPDLPFRIARRVAKALGIEVSEVWGASL